MERLTQRNEHDTSYFIPQCFEICSGMGCSEQCNNCHVEEKLIEKLGAYEDAEEQGLLLRLPCKVGDTVWLVNKLFSSEVKCLTIRWIEIVKGLGFHAELENGSGLLFYYYEIGKRVFLTKEEAEQKLAEMKGSSSEQEKDMCSMPTTL